MRNGLDYGRVLNPIDAKQRSGCKALTSQFSEALVRPQIRQDVTIEPRTQNCLADEVIRVLIVICGVLLLSTSQPVVALDPGESAPPIPARCLAGG